MAGQHPLCNVLVTIVNLGAVGFSSMILWWVRIFNELEVSGTLCPPLRVQRFMTDVYFRQQVCNYES